MMEALTRLPARLLEQALALPLLPLLHFARVACLLVSAGVIPAYATDATIHMAPDGSDSADGSSPHRAVATLNRAWELAMAGPEDSSAIVLVLPGIYRGQSLLLEGTPRLAVTVRGVMRGGQRPIFAGAPHSKDIWLRLRASDGRSSGLIIERLEIHEYHTAISLEGNRDERTQFNQGAVIRYNVFNRIGSISTGNVKPFPTAAVRFVNSIGNIVEENRFTRIRNATGCTALHALYLSHFASYNRIVDNTFDDYCGAAVKLRDRSNDNVIKGNTFTRPDGVPAIDEWFCDMKGRKGCTKKLGECPSTGNVEEHNKLESTDGSQRLAITGPSVPRPWCDAADFTRERVKSR